MLRVKPTAPFTHTDLARYLDDKKIGTRMFFGGNLLRQPAFVQLKRDNPAAFRIVDCSGASTPIPQSTIHNPLSPLPGADEIMHTTLFLGTYPGLSREMLDYEIAMIRAFILTPG